MHLMFSFKCIGSYIYIYINSTTLYKEEDSNNVDKVFASFIFAHMWLIEVVVDIWKRLMNVVVTYRCVCGWS